MMLINPVDTQPVYFNNLAVASCENDKYLGFLLDKRLSSDRYIEEMILKTSKA